jgi:tetratricopeptide (TPR) repeat protein
MLFGAMVVGLTWYYQVGGISNADRRAARRLDQINKHAFLPPAAPPVPSSAAIDETTTTAMSPSADLSQPSIKNAQALIDNGLINEGSAMLEKLIEQDPTDTQALMEMAMVFTLDLKDPQKARQILERILDVNPQHRAALNEMDLLFSNLNLSNTLTLSKFSMFTAACCHRLIRRPLYPGYSAQRLSQIKKSKLLINWHL